MTDCGDIADIAANGGTQVAETDCNIQCSGEFKLVLEFFRANKRLKQVIPVGRTPS